MSRRLTVLAACCGLAAGALPFVAPASAAGTPAGYPRAGCFDIKDAAGDAAGFLGHAPNDPDLDITGMAMEKTAKDFKVFVKVSHLGAGPQFSDGDRFVINFTFNGHVFGMAGSHFAHGTGAIRDGLAAAGQAAHTTQLSIDVPVTTSVQGVSGRLPGGNLGYVNSKLTFTWDTAHSWIVASVPVSDIEKYGGAKFGGILQSVGVYSSNDVYLVSEIADSTASDNSSTFTNSWKVGTNGCFTAPRKK